MPHSYDRRQMLSLLAGAGAAMASPTRPQPNGRRSRRPRHFRLASRAAILTGQYSHKNGVYTLNDRLDPKRNHVAKELQSAGYQTAMIGKWHLASDPTGFDYWNILPGQGVYHDPVFLTS